MSMRVTAKTVNRDALTWVGAWVILLQQSGMFGLPIPADRVVSLALIVMAGSIVGVPGIANFVAILRTASRLSLSPQAASGTPSISSASAPADGAEPLEPA